MTLFKILLIYTLFIHGNVQIRNNTSSLSYLSKQH